MKIANEMLFEQIKGISYYTRISTLSETLTIGPPVRITVTAFS